MADSHCHFNMLHSLPRAGAAIECLQDPDLTGHAAFFHFASFLSSFFWFPEAHGMPLAEGSQADCWLLGFDWCCFTPHNGTKFMGRHITERD